MSETEPTHDHGSNSVIGEILEFKGKRKEAKAFIQNCEIYFRLNPKRIAADDDGTKIFLALNKISDGAKEWKDAQIDELLKPGSTINWTAFKTAFLENWGEVDPAGNAFTQLLKLQQRPAQKGKRQIRLPAYVAQFKEIIKKAGITGEAAFHLFGKGLTKDEFEKAMITDPKSLEDWYNVAIRLDNIRTRTSAYQAGNGHASSSHDEWAMQVDHISVETELAIRAMSASERERYIKDGLCFICGEKGHMSGECPKRKK